MRPALHIHVAVHVGNIIKAGPICSIADNFLPVKEWSLLVDERHHAKAGAEETDKLSLSLFERVLTSDNVVYPMALRMAFFRIQQYYKANNSADTVTTGKGELQTPLLVKDVFKGMPISYERQADMIFSACDGRRFVVTDAGYIGLAPGETEIGDAVWVFKHVSMPFVCRDFAGGNGSEAAFKLVSSCHIQGVMQGAVWTGVDDDGDDVVGDRLPVESLVIF